MRLVGDMTSYSEQRLQPWWLLALGLTMTVSLGIAYGSAVSATFGTATAILSSALAAAWWWMGRSPIAVDAAGLRLGRMWLEPAAIGQIDEFDAAAFGLRTSIGSRADDMNSLLHRNGGGVVVQIVDASDPFAAWVIGSRRPAELAAALRELSRS